MLKTIKNIAKNNTIVHTAIVIFIYISIRILSATYRFNITWIQCKPHSCINTGVICLWHQDIIATAAFIIREKQSGTIIASPSPEGKVVGTIATKLGLKVIYGSAFKTTIRLIKNALQVLQTQKKIYIVGDGSRGPAKKLQSGVTYLAKKSNLPLIQINCNPLWKITLHKTWDEFQIPLPFSKIQITVQQIQK